MRTMTEEQAELYIRAGFFPKTTDIDAIVDLQDVYGHQRAWAIQKWLYMDETRENAIDLFSRIFNTDDLAMMIKNADRVRELEEEKEAVKERLDYLQREYDKLNRMVTIHHKNMFNED